MFTVTSVTLTTIACPTQWEGVSDDHRLAYARYRWGSFAVRVGAPGANIGDAVNGPTVIERQIGGELDGYMTFEELQEHTRGLVTWPASQQIGPDAVMDA